MVDHDLQRHRHVHGWVDERVAGGLVDDVDHLRVDARAPLVNQYPAPGLFHLADSVVRDHLVHPFLVAVKFGVVRVAHVQGNPDRKLVLLGPLDLHLLRRRDHEH